MIQKIHRLLHDNKGVALIEFAFVLPILLLMFAGAIELTRYIVANQKVDKAANSLADFVAQLQVPAAANEAQLFDTFGILMEPYSSTEGGFIITGVTREDAQSDPIIDWTKNTGKSGGTRVPGLIGNDGSVDGIQMKAGETFIAVEVFYEYEGILDNIIAFVGANGSLDLDGDQLYKRAFFIQRTPPAVPDGTDIVIPDPTGCCGDACDPNDPDFVKLPLCACDFPLNIFQSGNLTSFPVTRTYCPDGVNQIPHPDYNELKAYYESLGCRVRNRDERCPSPPSSSSGGGGGGGGSSSSSGGPPPPPPPCTSCRCNPAFCGGGGI